MKSRTTRLRFIFGSILLAVATAAVIGFDTVNEASRIKTRYLLSGTYSGTDSANQDFDYYDIGNNELAISLKDPKDGNEGNKTTYKGVYLNNKWTVTIPAVHPVSGKKITGIWHNAFHGSVFDAIRFESASNIKTIDFEAFFYSSITDITIPYSVSQIGDACFYSCEKLTNVAFINSAEESAGSALICDCEVEEPEEQEPEEQEPEQQEEEEQEEEPAVVYPTSELKLIPSYCFFRCTSLLDISLPSKVNEIGEEAFNGCTALATKIYFQNIEFIRERAFQGCVGLRAIYISKSMFNDADGTVGTIEPHAFNNCHENLTVYLCGDENSITTNWLPNHSNWRLTNDYGEVTECKVGYVDASNSFNADWTYTYDDTTGEATLTEYHGKAPTSNGGFIVVPNKVEGHIVTKIGRDVFNLNNVKSILKRLYLPTTLKAIDNQMFGYEYPCLYIVDDNKSCSDDVGKTDDQIDGRIDLSGLTDLEFIGTRAFCASTNGKGIGNGVWYTDDNGTPNNKNDDIKHYYYEKIKKLHLPSRLVAVGDEAFGIFQKRVLPYVTEFNWDYDSEKSRLECIGCDAFYGLGYIEIANKGKNNEGEIGGNELEWRPHSKSTLIFPKTFKYFGITNKPNNDLKNDRYRYNNKAAATAAGISTFDFNAHTQTIAKAARPAHAFLGCSLIKKVVFKGSMIENDPKCGDLIIPLQTFCFNESLETIVFEERRGHAILFHTQSGGSNNNHYAQESIGGNSGRGSNDFRGEPFLQTFVLPNKYTNLIFQPFAFHGNSRAALYLSGNLPSNGVYTGTNLYSNKTDGHWLNMANYTISKTLMTDAVFKSYQWKNIANEVCYKEAKNASEKGYYGFCFTKDARNQAALDEEADPSTNTFSINQEMPVYDNVYFYDDETKAEVGKDVSGNKNPRIFTTSDKCAYLCEENESHEKVATMTKYLYNLHDEDADRSTARVKKTVTVDGVNYEVRYIGDSAFSACYCDGTGVPDPNNYTDLQHIVLPDTIEEIGEYAFIRTYALQDISSYSDVISNASEGMPKNLEKIGKGAFMFSEIKAVRKIPYGCQLYETYEDTSKDISKIPSAFSNAVSLRKITFLNEAKTAEVNVSKYYTATTYSYNGAQNSDTYTSALYSNNITEEAKQNEDKLLIVLNRDVADYEATSEDLKANTAGTGYYFDGQYKSNPFLFGAYKMGYWIEELKCGLPTVDPNSNPAGKPYIQPLFSAVGTRAKGNGSTVPLTKKPIYLGVAGYLYDGLDCDLETIEGNVLNMPQYAFNGCEALLTVNFPQQANGEVPNGLFANVTKEATQYNTVDPSTDAIIHGDAHTLNLLDSGYISLGSESFKNNSSIYAFIAPDVENFTIGDSAFESCSKLTTIDLSHVTGTLTIGANAFKNIGKNAANNQPVSIIWPNDATVIIGDNAFNGFTKLTTLQLPKGLSSLGSSAFAGCTSLASVTCSDNLTALTSIGSSAFSGCTGLNRFDFDRLTALTSIGSSAFYNTGTLSLNGEISLNATSIGSSAFSKSKVTVVNILSNSVTIGSSAFESCTSLQAFRFSKSNCTWGGSGVDIFKNCTSLTELQLPSSYNVGNSGASIIGGCTNANFAIYLHHKYGDVSSITGSWRIIDSVPTDDYYFKVDTIGDLDDANEISISGGTINGDLNLEHWADVNGDGKATYIGTIQSYSGGVVTFSTGYVLDSNGFAKVISLTYNDQSGEYVGSVSAHKGDALVFTTDGGTTIINPANMARKDGAANNLTKDGDRLVVVWGNSDNIYIRDLGGGNWDAWFNAPATPTSYSILVNKAVTAAASQALEDNNKGQFSLTLAKNDILSVKYNEDILYFWESGTTASYQVLRPGTYVVCINENNRVFLRLPAKSASNITATVNGASIELTDIKEGGSSNVAEYSITLTAGDVISFTEGYDTLVFPNLNNATSFKALSIGAYTFYVNGSYDVYVAPEYINIYFTNNYSWSSVYCHAWKDGSNPEQNNGGWPGQAMTYSYTNDMSQGVYVITLDKSVYNRVIFNNNNGEQTETIVLGDSIVSGDGYYITGGATNNRTVGTWHNDND